MLSAIFVTLNETKQDPALYSRGDRKLLVTEIYDKFEGVATSIPWHHKANSGKSPVQLMKDTESAVFTHIAKQTRHKHKIGTEIYLLIEGDMTIEVDNEEYDMIPGDMIVVNPGVYHEVKRNSEFLCRVITVNCGGAIDRYDD